MTRLLTFLTALLVCSFANAEDSWRIPGRIIQSVPDQVITQQQCVVSTPNLPNAQCMTIPVRVQMYSVTAVDNTGQVTTTFSSNYNYIPGTPLWMRVYESGRIVLE